MYGQGEDCATLILKCSVGREIPVILPSRRLMSTCPVRSSAALLGRHATGHEIRLAPHLPPRTA
jgi:hypothetical protein